MPALIDMDNSSQDNDTDYLLKSLEPYPFLKGSASLKDPFSKSVDQKGLAFGKTKSKKPVKRRSWKKPKGKPKRPLSAYNLFFQYERENLIKSLRTDDKDDDNTSTEENNPSGENSTKLTKRRHRKTHGKIGFAQLARDISQKWKTLDAETLKGFEERARAEKERYKKEIEEWQKKTNNEKKAKEINLIELDDPDHDVHHAIIGASKESYSHGDVFSLLEESTASFSATNKSANVNSTIPDVQTSSTCMAIDETDLIARIYELNDRRLATRREHMCIMDATYALFQPKDMPITPEPAPISGTDLVKDEPPSQQKMFTEGLFDDMDETDTDMLLSL